MATNDENSTQNQNPVLAADSTAPVGENVLFDDLTVLSKELTPDTLINPDLLATTRERPDGAGLENIQATSGNSEVRDQLVLNGQRTEEASFELRAQMSSGQYTVGTMDTNSEGGQAPVPFVDQPLPAGYVEVENPGFVRTPPPGPLTPDVVTPIGGPNMSSGLTSVQPTTTVPTTTVPTTTVPTTTVPPTT
ncbi:MAG TPA: hypothetical protein VFF26_12265, partial [Gallionella sp.]|nr:hypothetical protein [Gallionella sp.]